MPNSLSAKMPKYCFAKSNQAKTPFNVYMILGLVSNMSWNIQTNIAMIINNTMKYMYLGIDIPIVTSVVQYHLLCVSN